MVSGDVYGYPPGARDPGPEKSGAGRDRHPQRRNLETNGAVSPRRVYADESRPEAVEGVRRIFIAMVEGIRDQAIDGGLIDADTGEKGIRDLYNTTEHGGSFSYTFFKGTGTRCV